MVDNLFRTNSYFYDALNRRTNTTFADGSKIITRFDAAGRRIAETDQATNTTQFAYDGLGRLTFVTNVLSKVTKYQYDEVGNLTNQVDALTHATKFEYDSLGRRTKHALPGNQVESFGYDAVGNLLAYTNFNSLVLTNQYDVMNRLWKKWNGSTVLETYTYDKAGQLTNRLDTSGTYTWVFDQRGRVTTNTTPVGTLYYQYDLNGNLTNLASATANGVSVGYQYDALNRVTNAIDNRLSGTKNTSYTFDGVGNLQSLKYPNGITNLWQYDSLDRLTNLTWKLNGAQRGDFTYKLGAAGNRTNLVDNVNGSSRTFTWQYDSVYRLTNEVVSGAAPTGNLGYTYDDDGNRLSRTGSLGSLGAVNYTYNANDQISPGESYDNNGNTTVTLDGYSFGYDYANRLTNSGSSINIFYGADGNRVKKVTSTSTNLYLIATVNPTGYPQVVEELTVTGGGVTNMSRVYAYGLALISQRESSGTVHYFGMDGLGSIRFLTDSTGAVSDQHVFEAFGTQITSSGSTPVVYLFAGEQSDGDLNAYYQRARYYKNNEGRFLTMDSFAGRQADPLSLHKYLFTEDDPVNHTDPSGHSLVDVLTTTSIIFSFAAQTLPSFAVAIRSAWHQAWPDAFGVGFYGSIGVDVGLQAAARILTITHPLGELLDFTGTPGFIGGLYIVFAPREQKAAAYLWGGVEGALSQGNTGRFLKRHTETGIFETWHWNYRLGEDSKFHPFSVGGIDARGALYGFESDGGLFFGASTSHDPSLYVVGFDKSITLGVGYLSEGAMIANVGWLHSFISFNQGRELLGRLPNPGTIAAAGIVNAGFTTTWISNTYGRK